MPNKTIRQQRGYAGVAITITIVMVTVAALTCKARWPDFSNIAPSTSEKEIAITYFNEGVRLEELGDLETSLKAYDLALRADPKFEFAMANRASIKLKMNDLSGAMKDADSAMDLDQNDSIAYFTKAEALTALHEYDAAISVLNQALRQPGADRAALLQSRGHNLAKLSRLPEAISDTTQALKFAPRRGQLYCNLAIFYAREDLIHETREAITSANRIAPNEPCVKQLTQISSGM